jgi:hypothetical protein
MKSISNSAMGMDGSRKAIDADDDERVSEWMTALVLLGEKEDFLLLSSISMSFSSPSDPQPKVTWFGPTFFPFWVPLPENPTSSHHGTSHESDINKNREKNKNISLSPQKSLFNPLQLHSPNKYSSTIHNPSRVPFYRFTWTSGPRVRNLRHFDSSMTTESFFPS